VRAGTGNEVQANLWTGWRRGDRKSSLNLDPQKKTRMDQGRGKKVERFGRKLGQRGEGNGKICRIEKINFLFAEASHRWGGGGDEFVVHEGGRLRGRFNWGVTKLVWVGDVIETS